MKETVFFRLYSRPGCSYCVSAEKWFADKGVPLQVIEVDPLIEKGIPMALGRPDLQVPIFISLTEMKLVIGYKPEEYESSVALCASRPSFNPLNAPVIDGELVGDSAAVAQTEALATQ